ncbi:MAG: hypothetical protein AAGJ32_11315 [Pseudomonadota bacterium]
MISRLSSITCLSESTNTGTVPLGEAASISAGLSRNTTSRSHTGTPQAESANRARIA